MNVFISWSGERSRVMATIMHRLLRQVLQYTDPWMSDSDIEAGKRWSIEIADQLEKSDFGIVCLSPENMHAPWLLFEAGGIAKSVHEGAVVPLLLEMDQKDLSGPLAQFQAKKFGKQAVLDILLAINRNAGESARENKEVEEHLDLLWSSSDYEKSVVEAVPRPDLPSQTRTQDEILEELVGTIRKVERFFDYLAARGATLEEPEFKMMERAILRESG